MGWFPNFQYLQVVLYWNFSEWLLLTYYFGYNVQTDSPDEESTAINMRVRTPKGDCDITISKEGQISTHTKAVTVDRILDFYHTVKDDLLGTKEAV